jgi:hypothetical protein
MFSIDCICIVPSPFTPRQAAGEIHPRPVLVPKSKSRGLYAHGSKSLSGDQAHYTLEQPFPLLALRRASSLSNI